MNKTNTIPKVTSALLSTLALVLPAASSAYAQAVLIGPTTRNGSFEDGNLPPWMTVADDAAVVEDAVLASHGEWLAILSETAVSSIARPSTFQALSADAAEGRNFSLTFDAGNGTNGFDGVRVFFNVRDSSGGVVLVDNVFFQLPSSNPGEWESYQRDWLLSPAWDGGQLSLGLQFEKADALVGTTYSGNLDHVVLTQIPEPSALTLLGLGGILLMWDWTRRHRGRP